MRQATRRGWFICHEVAEGLLLSQMQGVLRRSRGSCVPKVRRRSPIHLAKMGEGMAGGRGKNVNRLPRLRRTS